MRVSLDVDSVLTEHIRTLLVVPPNLYFTPLYFKAFLTILSALEDVFLVELTTVLEDEHELKINEKNTTKINNFFISYNFKFLVISFAVFSEAPLPPNIFSNSK